MSEPTYRIDLEHDPAERTIPWTAAIVRIAGEEWERSFYGETRDDALAQAQEWARLKAQPAEPRQSVYLTEDGELA